MKKLLVIASLILSLGYAQAAEVDSISVEDSGAVARDVPTLGISSGAACATDNGTCTAGALLKRIAQRLTTIIAGIPVTNAGTFLVQAAQSGTWNIATVTTVTAVTAITNALPAGNANIGDVDAVQSGTWTVQPGNTANTTAWLASISQGGNTATVATAGADDLTNSTIGVNAYANLRMFDGTTWDRVRGASTTGLEVNCVTGCDASAGDVTVTTVNIANGASLSAEVDLGSEKLYAIVMPASWTTANLTFSASATTGGTFANIYDDGGSELVVTAAASRSIFFANPGQLYPFQFIKIRSGTSGTPVNQGGSRDLLFLSRAQ